MIRLNISRPPVYIAATVLLIFFVLQLIPAAGSPAFPVGSRFSSVLPAMNPVVHSGARSVAAPVTGTRDTGMILPGMQTAVGRVTASRPLLERTGSLFTPFVSSLVVFALSAGISAVLILFLRRKYPEPAGRQPETTTNRAFLAAGSYIVLGSVLAVLSVLVMTGLAALPAGPAIVTGGKILCVLCFYLSVSSFFQAQGILRSASFPGITTLHGVLAALAIMGFAFLMFETPERRGIVQFLLIVALAASAVLPFWQIRRQPQSSPGATPAGRAVQAPDQRSATVVYPAGSGESGGDRAGEPAGPVSGFPPQLKGNYYDVSYIGSGGFAMVFSAFRKSDGEKVAIKIPLSHDEATGKSFLNEIHVWETLRHPNIVRVSAVNILPVPYVEMEFVPSSLDTLKKPLPLPRALKMIAGIADALGYAHGLGIVHRDIKPHNILLEDDLTPKITDWGMSKDLFGGSYKKSSIVGYSVDYAAPEQLSPALFGKTDQRTDIYQLGVVFYELVTGSLPFPQNNVVDTADAIVHTVPAPPSRSNPDAAPVDGIIQKCLEKEPSKRFQSAPELRDALLLAEAGSLPMNYSRFSLSELAARVIDSGEYATMAEIVTEVPSDLCLEGDFKKLSTVLNTLVSNAVTYSKPPRKIRVAYQSSPEDLFHHLSVRDNGPGITGTRLDCIFAPPGAPAGDGKPGLSLAIAKKFVQMHGGYISVDSIANIGSTFTVHIPKTPLGRA